MSALGILKGRTEERFAPNAPITRAEFAAIGVELLVSYEETAHLCFDKFEM